jgi:hypothetical protein
MAKAERTDPSVIDKELDEALLQYEVSARRRDLEGYRREVQDIVQGELEALRAGIRDVLKSELGVFQRTLKANAERVMKEAAVSAARSTKAFVQREMLHTVREEDGTVSVV